MDLNRERWAMGLTQKVGHTLVLVIEPICARLINAVDTINNQLSDHRLHTLDFINSNAESIKRSVQSRNIKKKDTVSLIKAGTRRTVLGSPCPSTITAERLDSTLRVTLDKHTPVFKRRIIEAPISLWFYLFFQRLKIKNEIN
ncbi:hypothetical protein RRG08_007797 [Elysia crispata]|uniref:Uncharacterized protein n=1 Tax=Elysia crispata TaxID=231223 RepID=A0AAE1ALU8_9GAST|nr:hypothetical protein RRG08_007797 [Elysia crispata]